MTKRDEYIKGFVFSPLMFQISGCSELYSVKIKGIFLLHHCNNYYKSKSLERLLLQCKAALLWTSWVLDRVKLPCVTRTESSSQLAPHESCRNGQATFSSKMTTVSFPAAGNAFLLRNAAESKLHN